MSTPLVVYELPNNIVNGTLIPLSTLPVPVAALSLEAGENAPIIIRGTVGWQVTLTDEIVQKTVVLFKIWRGAPYSGTLIYSIRDSGESWADMNKTTSFVHVDDGIVTAGIYTYTLTVELASVGKANIVGPLLFSLTDINA